MINRKLANLVLLIGSFGAGQGSIFLAQSWLLAHGNLELLAQFGTHFSFAMLGIIIVEAGSLTILARTAALASTASPDQPGMWQVFWETCVLRVMLATVIVLGIVLFLVLGTPSAFSRDYALFSIPAFVIWSINAAGFLDGLKLSGVSGITGSLAYVVPAAALVLLNWLPKEHAGAFLGGAFSVGYLLVVSAQFVALRVAGSAVRFARPTRKGVFKSAHDGLAMLGSTLPGQLTFRAQLAMSTTFLGADATAIFIYVKQIIVAIAQVIGFVRRVEFPALVARLSLGGAKHLSTVTSVQMSGTIFALIATIVVAAAGLVLALISDRPDLVQVGWLLSTSSLVIFASAIFLGLDQGLAALAKYRSMFMKATLVTVASVSASYIFVLPFGVFGLVFADIISAALSIAISVYILNRSGLRA